RPSSSFVLCLSSFPTRRSSDLAFFFICGFPALGLSFIPELFALGECQLNLHFPILEVHACGNEGEAALLCLADQLTDFFFMEQLDRKSTGVKCSHQFILYAGFL